MDLPSLLSSPHQQEKEGKSCHMDSLKMRNGLWFWYSCWKSKEVVQCIISGIKFGVWHKKPKRKLKVFLIHLPRASFTSLSFQLKNVCAPPLHDLQCILISLSRLYKEYIRCRVRGVMEIQAFICKSDYSNSLEVFSDNGKSAAPLFWAKGMLWWKCFFGTGKLKMLRKVKSRRRGSPNGDRKVDFLAACFDFNNMYTFWSILLRCANIFGRSPLWSRIQSTCIGSMHSETS